MIPVSTSMPSGFPTMSQLPPPGFYESPCICLRMRNAACPLISDQQGVCGSTDRLDDTEHLVPAGSGRVAADRRIHLVGSGEGRDRKTAWCYSPANQAHPPCCYSSRSRRWCCSGNDGGSGERTMTDDNQNESNQGKPVSTVRVVSGSTINAAHLADRRPPSPA